MNQPYTDNPQDFEPVRDDAAPPAPQDAALEALLDEALAPQPMPQQLAERILARTAPLLPREQPVLATIVQARPFWMSRGAWAAAAVLLFGVTFGLMMSLTQPDAQPGGPSMVDQRPAGVYPNGELAMALLADDLALLAWADQPLVDDLDHRIELLALHVDMLHARSDWSNAQASLEDALLYHELDQLAHDDLYLF